MSTSEQVTKASGGFGSSVSSVLLRTSSSSRCSMVEMLLGVTPGRLKGCLAVLVSIGRRLDTAR